MVYLEYESFKKRYLATQHEYSAILMEKENLFTMTQPKAIKYNSDRVQSSHSGNVFDDYLIAKESKQIDERLSEARSLLDDREKLLELKEKELRLSNDKTDIVYCLKYIEGMSTNSIAKRLNYSKSQVYRVLDRIKIEIRKDGKKCDK